MLLAHGAAQVLLPALGAHALRANVARPPALAARARVLYLLPRRKPLRVVGPDELVLARRALVALHFIRYRLARAATGDRPGRQRKHSEKQQDAQDISFQETWKTWAGRAAQPASNAPARSVARSKLRIVRSSSCSRIRGTLNANRIPPRRPSPRGLARAHFELCLPRRWATPGDRSQVIGRRGAAIQADSVGLGATSGPARTRQGLGSPGKTEKDPLRDGVLR